MIKFAVAFDYSAEALAKSQQYEIKVVYNLQVCLHRGTMGDILLVVSDRPVSLCEGRHCPMDTDDIVAGAGVGCGCVCPSVQKIYPK